MIRTLIFFIVLLLPGGIRGQGRAELSLREAYSLLEEQYPALRKGALLSQKEALALENLEKDCLPGIYFRTDGRLQSQNIQLESSNPDFPIRIDQPLVNVKSYLEAEYTLLDGGLIEGRQAQEKARIRLEEQRQEVDKFSLRRRINGLFLELRQLRAREELFTFFLNDLGQKIEVMQAGVREGIVLESELRKLEVRRLEILSQQSDNQFRQQGAVRSLASLTGVELAQDIQLSFPALGAPETLPAINRPETLLFQRQKELLQTQSDLLEVYNRPRLMAFAQAGVGYPNPLNLLDNGVAPYGLIGLGFSWKLADWNQTHTRREQLSIQAREVALAEETFLFNLEQQNARYFAELERIREKMRRQEEIIELQEEIRIQLSAQLEEGVLPATDYISQINTLLAARQQQVILETQLLQIQLTLWSERGAF